MKTLDPLIIFTKFDSTAEILGKTPLETPKLYSFLLLEINVPSRNVKYTACVHLSLPFFRFLNYF